jgi:uncharacterized membrane protein
MVIAGLILLWLNARTVRKQGFAKNVGAADWEDLSAEHIVPVRRGLYRLYRLLPQKVIPNPGGLSERIVNWLSENWGLVLILLVAIPLSSYNLSYEPYWQDELSSYFASRGVLAHGLPFFPSGFLYPKAEIYSYLLALWTTLLGEQGGVPRAISLLEYLASLPLLYVAGCYFFDRGVALLATAILAFSPTSLIWSRQMRMYEQEQLMALLAFFLLYKAIEHKEKARPAYIAIASLLIMYLSHEESFILLPGFLICVLIASMDGKRPLPGVMYYKHWWIGAILAVAVIALQLAIAKFSHPPILGTDSSQRPLVGFTIDNIPYYFDLLYYQTGLGNGVQPFIAIDAILATLGCIWARRGSNMRIKYCALFYVVSLLTLVLLFTAHADRYFYALMPTFSLMAAYAMLVILRSVWAFACSRIAFMRPQRSSVPVFTGYITRRMHTVAIFTMSLLYIAVLAAPILPIAGYNLFISQLAGFSYHRHYADYDVVGQYLQQHERKGDIVINVSPSPSVLYYTKHADYYFSVDRALFIIEQNGNMVETASGAHPLLSQGDFDEVLSTYPRVWIVSDNGPYQAAVFKKFNFPPDFRKVYEGYGSALYFRGNP